MSRKISHKTKFLTLALTSILAVGFWGTEYISSQTQTLSSLQEGVNTCFSRVRQSFTAKITGMSGDLYLDKGFMGMTESCFGEAHNMIEGMASASLSRANRNLNIMMTSLGNYHRKLSLDGTSLKRRESIDRGFSALENQSLGIIDELYIRQQSLASSKKYILYFLAVIALLIPVLISLDLYSYINQKHALEEVEVEAKMNLARDKVEKETIDRLVDKAFEVQDLAFCQQLYKRYSREKEVRANSSLTHISVNEAKKGPQISIVNAPATHEMAGTNVDNIFSRVIELSSDKIFQSGTKLSIDAGENLFASVDEEVMEQVLFQTFSYTLAQIGKSDRTKLKISLKNESEEICIRFSTNGEALSFSMGDIEFQIIAELLKDIGGAIFVSSAGQLVVTTPTTTKKISGANLLSFRKGTKRELMSSMS